MPKLRPLTIVACIQDDELKRRCLESVDALKRSGQLAKVVPWFDCATGPTPNFDADQTRDYLHHLSSASDKQATIVLSDALAKPTSDGPNPGYEPSQWAKEIIDPFEDWLLGTIAILERYQRVPEIDRVLVRNFDAAGLLDEVRLTAERLIYVAPPEPQVPRYPFVVRQIETKTELQSYFKLRHQVYRIMGYLDQKVEFAETRMEIDWCDTTAIPIGLFELNGQRETLVGTARVARMASSDVKIARMTKELAETDPRLRTKLETSPLLFGLPIFQSMPINGMFRLVMTTEPMCGELGRVIVDKNYRGMGLSGVLTNYAMLKAMEKGIDRLLLECLPLHEPVYRKLGFARIAGVAGRVIGVNKTMIAMELTPSAIEAMRLEGRTRRGIEIMQNQGFLCACRANDCHRGLYHLYRNNECPIVKRE